MSSLRVSAPLLDAYLSYFESKRLPFTIPGHKQRAARLDAGLGAVVDCYLKQQLLCMKQFQTF